MQLNPNFIKGQILSAPGIDPSTKSITSINVVLIDYLPNPRTVNLNNGLKLTLDCIIADGHGEHMEASTSLLQAW